jgi:hypothetical protein
MVQEGEFFCRVSVHESDPLPAHSKPGFIVGRGPLTG